MKTILFVCVHNSGRSLMAEAILNAEAEKRGLPVRAISAGTEPGEAPNPMAVEALREIGIEIGQSQPKLLTPEMLSAADKVVTMGCGVEADRCPAGFLASEDWGLDDPKDRPLEEVRRTRDAVRRRVLALLADVGRA